MNETIKITIATVVFNASELIKETVSSVINQTYENIEYIIIDGNSTDGTAEFINRIINTVDIFLSEKDKGIYDAMNKALNLATGDFLLFMNAGDSFVSEDTVEEFVRKISCRNSVYYGDAIYQNKLTGESKYRGIKFNKYKLARTNICHQTIFYPLKAYKDNKYDLKYKLFADWALNMKLFKNFNFIYINQPIAYYESTGISAVSKDLNFEQDQKKLILKHLGFDTIIFLILNKIKNIIFRKNYIL